MLFVRMCVCVHVVMNKYHICVLLEIILIYVYVQDYRHACLPFYVITTLKNRNDSSSCTFFSHLCLIVMIIRWQGDEQKREGAGW